MYKFIAHVYYWKSQSCAHWGFSCTAPRARTRQRCTQRRTAESRQPWARTGGFPDIHRLVRTHSLSSNVQNPPRQRDRVYGRAEPSREWATKTSWREAHPQPPQTLPQVLQVLPVPRCRHTLGAHTQVSHKAAPRGASTGLVSHAFGLPSLGIPHHRGLPHSWPPLFSAATLGLPPCLSLLRPLSLQFRFQSVHVVQAILLSETIFSNISFICQNPAVLYLMPGLFYHCLITTPKQR